MHVWARFRDPAISVTYNVRATDSATGANVCNTTVPFGTKIKFEFVPHVYRPNTRPTASIARETGASLSKDRRVRVSL